MSNDTNDAATMFRRTSSVRYSVVGLDVHSRSVAASIRVDRREEKYCVIPADDAAVIATLRPWEPRHVVYEAGPTGYHLARAYRRGYSCDDRRTG